MRERWPGIDPGEDPADRPLHKAALPNPSWRQEVPEPIHGSIEGPMTLARGSRARLVQVEGRLRGIRKFFRKFFPSVCQNLPAFDDPAHMLGFVRAPDIGAGISEPAKNRDHARGAFEPGSLTRILCLYFLSNLFDKFRR